jgi:starch synthase
MVEASTDALLASINRALALFIHDQKTWCKIQHNGMSKNLSWDKSALEYLQVYQSLL